MSSNWGDRGRMAVVLLLALFSAAETNAASCTVSSSGLAFGSYQPLTIPGKFSSTAATSTASVSVVCTGIISASTYTISLGPSIVGNGDRISTRFLANSDGGDHMIFNVYREPSYSTIWGDGITAGGVLGGTLPTGDSNQLHAVYGKVAAGQNTLKAGSFSGSLTMTLTYNP
jgi:spore coat protein U-like protein